MLVSAGEQCPAASTEAVSDEAVFRDKLRLMGKCECPASSPHPQDGSSESLRLSLWKRLHGWADWCPGPVQAVSWCLSLSNQKEALRDRQDLF